jgi:hypothetical protein
MEASAFEGRRPDGAAMNPMLEAFALQALENPQTYADARQIGQLPWDAVRQAVEAIDAWLTRPVTHAAWNMPALAEALVTWAAEAPAAYAAFIAPVAPASAQQSLAALPGLWQLNTVLLWLSDDHDYVLDTTADRFCLAHQESVTPFQPLVEPTELAHAIRAHRGLAPLMEAPTATVSAALPRHRRAGPR